MVLTCPATLLKYPSRSDWKREYQIKFPIRHQCHSTIRAQRISRTHIVFPRWCHGTQWFQSGYSLKANETMVITPWRTKKSTQNYPHYSIYSQVLVNALIYSNGSSSAMICRTTPATMIRISRLTSGGRDFSASGFTSSDKVLNFIALTPFKCPIAG